MKTVSDTNLLLLIIGKTKNSKFALSTKVFEYMLSGNTVLGLGPTDGAAADLVHETNIGSFFEREDFEGIRDFILEMHEAHQHGKLEPTPNHDAIKKYSFEHLTSQLENQISTLIKS